MQPVSILITGSSYWNAGDSIVLEGVMALLRAAAFPREVNWFFYDFTAPHRHARGFLGERRNTVEASTIAELAPALDLVVVPGLMAGRELADFYKAVNAAGLGPKTICLGGMNENEYCAHWCKDPDTAAVLAQSPLVVARTKVSPVKCYSRPCPSILCAGSPEDVGHGPVVASIQIPHGHPLALVNHSTSRSAYESALAAVREIGDVTLVCHCLDEFLFFREKRPEGVSKVLFSSWFQDYWDVYRRARCVVSTRLHSVLWGFANGNPGIVVNDSPRHEAALDLIPLVPLTMDWTEAADFPNDVGPEFRTEAADFKTKTWGRYMALLKECVEVFHG